jgi:hypothetical protein
MAASLFNRLLGPAPPEPPAVIERREQFMHSAVKDVKQALQRLLKVRWRACVASARASVPRP